jgi:hypothetical protein
LAAFYVGDCTFGNKYNPMVVSSVVADPGNVLLVVRSCNIDRYEAVCVTRTALMRSRFIDNTDCERLFSCEAFFYRARN